MKRMLFNATHAEELRVAIVDGQKLIDIDIEQAGRESRKSNIYKGVITRVEPSLEACFVNYGEERHGFLPFKEISKQFFKSGADARSSIREAVTEGMEVLVQIDKEERGNKGAALTTFVSLAGRYLVLMPNNPRGGGVSRRVEGEDRQELRETMDKLDVPAGMSLIARTAGIGRSAEELQWDLNYLLQLWRAIDEASRSMSGAFLIYQESSLVIRAIRDYFTADIGEILIDTDDIYEQARQFMGYVMPDNVARVKRYRDDTPLFSRFQIEHQIETAHSRLVPLPSGGAIVIDHTEALVSIDVNSARATRGSDIEETALKTNLEAADEVARQMRLRDLGGLLVIDFIDMESTKNQREVEQRLKEALYYDRARVQMGKISRFGLMELSRQRLRPALAEGSHIACPRCNGTGFIRDTESSALHLLRVIQEEAMKENSAAVHAQVPVDVATYLLNEKRAEIAKMEARLKVDVVLIPNKHIETPHYKLERLKHDDERLAGMRVSYSLADGPAEDGGYLADKLEPPKPRQEAVVKGVAPAQPAPMPAARPAAPPAAAPEPRRAEAAAAHAAPQARVPAAAPGTSSDGLFGRILGWFRRKAANEASAGPGEAGAGATGVGGDAARRAEGESRGGRGERGRGEGRGEGRGARGGRGREERGGREDRPREDGRRRGGEARPAQEPRTADAARNGEAGRTAPEGGRGGDAARGAEAGVPREAGQGRRGRDDARREGRNGTESRNGTDGRAVNDARNGAEQRAEPQRGEGQAARGEAAQRGEQPPRRERTPRGERGERSEGRRGEAEAGALAQVPADAAAALVGTDTATGTSTAPIVPPPAAMPLDASQGTTEVDDVAVSPDSPAAEGSAGADAADGNGEQRRRRRRRRGGRRDRPEGADGTDASDGPDAVDMADAAGAPEAVNVAAAPVTGAADAPFPWPVSRPASPVQAPAPQASLEVSAQTVATATPAGAPPATAATAPSAPEAPEVSVTSESPVESVPSMASEAPGIAAAPQVAHAAADVAAAGDRVAEEESAAQPAPTAMAAPAASEVTAAPATPAAPAAPAATSAVVPIEAIVRSAGLELVETRSAAFVEPAPAPAPRAPRPRRRRVEPVAEPLQQVETRGDDPQA